MTLRVRLLLSGLAIAVPLALVWLLLDVRQRLVSKEEELRLSVALDVANGLHARCLADPPREGRPGRGGSPDFTRTRNGRPRRGPGPSGAYEYFAYDANRVASASDAPPLPPEPGAVASAWTRAVDGPSLVVPLAPDGPCAFILARIPPRPGERRTQLEALALVLVSVLAAAWIGGGPVIGRLRRLELALRASAGNDYASPIPVEGRDELTAVAAAFNDARERIRQHADDARARAAALRTYVANTTHDIATPLSALQGRLAELERSTAERADARDRVREAMRDAHYMSSLLRNLATAAALDAPEAVATVSAVDLGQVVERVVARHGPLARAQAVSLDHATPPRPVVIHGDPTMVEQLLSNLVDNAVRYNRPGGHVAVLLDVERDDRFVLSVVDDGPGVSEAELALLTTRWFRGDEARTRRPDGTGIGLAIAAEAASRLGFTLSFSRPSEGGLRADVRPASGDRHGQHA